MTSESNPSNAGVPLLNSDADHVARGSVPALGGGATVSMTGDRRPKGGWLRAMLEHGSEGVALLDERGEFLFLGPSIQQVLGYTELELIGGSWVRLIHPEDRRQARQILDDIQKEPDRIARAELRLRHKDGTWRWIEGTGRNRLDEPDVGAIVCHFHDATGSRAVEGRLRQSEDQFQRIFQACPLPVGITTAHEGRFLEVNDAFLNLTGFTWSEVLGRTATELRLWVNPADRDQVLEQMRTGQRVRQYQTRFRTKSDHCYDALVSVESLRLGNQDCWLVISTDITDRRWLEQQELRAQRLENLGALAGGIAHDLNNIFTPVLAASELLRERASDPESIGMLELLQSNARRGAQLVRQIRALVQGGRGSRFQVELPPSSQEGSIPCAEGATSNTTEVLRLNQGRQEGVLLVDDEAAVLELLRSILESLNYRVWTAGDGAEALQLYREHSDQIRVVVTDLVMPRLDGAALVACLRDLNAPVKIICTTGLPSAQASSPLPAADGFLPKPFSLGQFIRMLNEQVALS